MPSYPAPRIVEITLTDDDGTRRVFSATRRHGNSNLAHWDAKYSHPGYAVPVTFSGPEILDAGAKVIVDNEHTFNRARSRGYREHPMLADRNVSIDDAGNSMRADVVMSGRDNRPRRWR
jgi:hypothetical protein